MSDGDSLQQRGKALEEEFFRRIDEKLQTDLRRKLQRQEARQQLVAATGFRDEALLDQLLDAGFESTTIAAMTLVPLVFVAWADGSISPEERKAICDAASKQGAGGESRVSELLTSWMQERPARSLWELWKEYFQTVSASLTPDRVETLRSEILRMATDVAKASGGAWGFGKISDGEQSILDQIARIAPPRSA